MWAPAINEELATSGVGIVCLTNGNKDKPWILFETGALAKGLSSNRVCTLLIDLQPNDLVSPLSQFNHTLPTKESMFQLVTTINSSLKDKGLAEGILAMTFETYWPQFNKAFEDIIATLDEVNIEVRKAADILGEVLTAVREFERRQREMEYYIGKVSTKDSVDAEDLYAAIRQYNLNHQVRMLLDHGLDNSDVQETLSGQGYSRREVRQALGDAMM